MIRTLSSRSGYFSRNQQGQSTVEYVAVLLALIVLFGSFSPILGDDPTEKKSIFSILSNTISNKYKSYCFGVAISDPPSEAFDERVEKETNFAKYLTDELKKLLETAEHPDQLTGE